MCKTLCPTMCYILSWVLNLLFCQVNFVLICGINVISSLNCFIVGFIGFYLENAKFLFEFLNLAFINMFEFLDVGLIHFFPILESLFYHLNLSEIEVDSFLFGPFLVKINLLSCFLDRILQVLYFSKQVFLLFVRVLRHYLHWVYGET